jgi:hypothetical protein
MRKPVFKPIFISRLAIPMSPKTRSQRFRAWLEKWLPVRFGPRTSAYPLGDVTCEYTPKPREALLGDDKTIETCRDRFNNIRFDGTEPYIPPPESIA